MEKEIRITNELDELSALAIFVDEFCSDLSLPTETTMHINLALEEAVSNVIMYAYPLEEHHEIRLKASLTDNQLIYLLTDKGLNAFSKLRESIAYYSFYPVQTYHSTGE